MNVETQDEINSAAQKVDQNKWVNENYDSVKGDGLDNGVKHDHTEYQV